MIVHVFNSSVVSGPETLVLPALAKMQLPSTVLFLNELRCGARSRQPIEYAVKLGLAVDSIDVSARYDRRAICALREKLGTLAPAIVHAHDVKASSFVLWAARRAGRRLHLVSTHHGVRGRSGLKARIFEEFYVRFVLPRFDRTLAVCSADRDLLIRRGLSAGRVLLHLNGIDGRAVALEERAAEAARIREAWGVAGHAAPDAVVMGYAGRLSAEKGLDRVLRVLRALRGVPPWMLLVFGCGPEEARLRALAVELGLGERVQWMGYRAGLGAEMAGFDLLLSLSGAEGLPINLLEAAWAATPAFCTAVDGILDLYPNGEGAALISPALRAPQMAEQLAPLLRDRERREQLGRAAQERVSKFFSGRVWRERLQAIYGDLTSR